MYIYIHMYICLCVCVCVKPQNSTLRNLPAWLELVGMCVCVCVYEVLVFKGEITFSSMAFT